MVLQQGCQCSGPVATVVLRKLVDKYAELRVNFRLLRAEQQEATVLKQEKMR